MSMRALKQAVETRLRSAACFNDLTVTLGRNIRRAIRGQPMPKAGQWFIGIDGDGFSNQDHRPQGLDETYGILVVVTFRMDYAPDDRKANQLTLDEHLDDTVDRVRRYLHGDYTTLATANTTIGASANGFVEPLSFLSASRAIEKGPEWFWSEADQDGPAGVAVEMRFGGARRIQLLGSVT